MFRPWFKRKCTMEARWHYRGIRNAGHRIRTGVVVAIIFVNVGEGW